MPLRPALNHPLTGERLEFQAPLAADLANVLAELHRPRGPES